MRSFAEVMVDASALPPAIAQRLAEALDAYCGLYVLSEDRQWLLPLAVAGSLTCSAADLASLRRLAESAPKPVHGAHALARALQTGEPVLVGDLTTEMLQALFQRPGDCEVAHDLRIRQLLFLPLRVRDAKVGGLSMVRHGESCAPFSDGDIQLAQQLAEHAALALANAQLFAKAQHELAERTRMQHQLRILSELSQELAVTATDLPVMLQLVARRLGELLGELCMIRCLDDRGARSVGTDVLYHPSSELQDELLALLRTEPLTSGSDELFERRCAEGKPLRFADSEPQQLSAALAEYCRPLAARLALSSLLVVPLPAAGKVIGLIMMGRSLPGRPFSAEDERLVEDVARHSALAVNNARLFAARLTELGERRRMAERLRVLSESSRDFAAATGDSAKLIELATRRIGEVIGESCIIRMVAEDGQSLETHGSLYHENPAVLESARVAMLHEPQRIGVGVAGQVMATGQPVIITAPTSELVAHIHPRFAPIFHALRVTSFLSAPLLSRGRVIGVITMSRTSSSPPYSQEDLEFVSELATHASLAIHNSRLLESVQRELAERQRTESVLRRTEEQFRQAQKMEAVGRLAGGIAHDFNNLLSVVLGYTGFLLDDLEASDPRRDDLVQIRNAGERAVDLTRQLLAFSRQQVLAPRVLDLNEVVTDMEKMIRRVVGEDVTVRTLLVRSVGLVKADRGHLGQVVMNLVVNARDAMPRGGTLTIQTANVELDDLFVNQHFGFIPGPYVMLAISDTGIGIDKATQQRIFEPFFTTKEQGKGTGLGLSTVFGIVEQSGGHMWVDSELGKGSTFRVYLPRTQEALRMADLAAELLPLRGGETVLIVEDDAQVRAVARHILRRHGYKVLEAGSGQEALQLCAEVELNFELLITDVVMPKMSGRELAERFLAQRPELRVLYMSGYNDEAILQHRLLAPGLELLHKPFTPESLLCRVREVLGQDA